MNWKQELQKRIEGPETLERFFPLTPEEKEFFSVRQPEDTFFCFQAAPSFMDLIGKDPNDPLRRQFIPSSKEFVFKSRELADPLGEEEHKPVARLVHRYHDRALLLVSDECAMYCRYCFRRSFTRSGQGALAGKELAAAVAYLAKHREIKDLLLSGGDPLVLEDGQLLSILDAVKAVRPDIVFRIGTRVPGVLPSRITKKLVRGLRARSPLWIVAHFNHPRELSEGVTAALARFVDAGIPALSQTVLLRGINDSPEILEELFRGLMSRRVKPYYLFQGDLAPGTSHFRVPLERGLAIMKELRRNLSSIALPTYAVDLPGGGGKVPLTESYLTGEDEDSWLFTSIEGRPHRYPKES